MARMTTQATAERERGVCCSIEVTVPDERATELATVLKALADPTRVQIIAALREASEPLCTCDFTATSALSQPTITHHMQKLREAGLVDATRKGIWTYYRLRPRLPANIRTIIEALA
jgi:ArsR family transcriptional regulator, arsenate/arsenite/antimonite-responsive transcriptional repressor